jgi:hypothetical protein
MAHSVCTVNPRWHVGSVDLRGLQATVLCVIQGSNAYVRTFLNLSTYYCAPFQRQNT